MPATALKCWSVTNVEGKTHDTARDCLLCALYAGSVCNHSISPIAERGAMNLPNRNPPLGLSITVSLAPLPMVVRIDHRADCSPWNRAICDAGSAPIDFNCRQASNSG